MHILEVVEPCSGGVGRHVRVLCPGLVAQGHQLTVAYSPHRIDEAFERFIAELRGEIRFVPLSIRREVSPASDLPAIIQLLRLIKLEGPFDVVHGHSSKAGALARIAGRCFGIPTVYTPHALIMCSPTISRAKSIVYTLIEFILGRCATSNIIAVSADERKLIRSLKLAPNKRVALIENGIDDQDFEYFSKETSYNEDLGQKPLTFGSTMRFDAQKAPGHLIEAFIRLSNMLPQLPMRLVVAGDGELFTSVKAEVEASGLDGKISLLGWRTNIREVLQELDIFVISSLYEAGLSYSTMEAMAAKLPIVSTSVFGTRGTLSRLPGNILVPVGDPIALAGGMKQMATLTEPESLRQELRSIGQANRDYVRLHFRQSEITRRILEIYQRCAVGSTRLGGHPRV